MSLFITDDLFSFFDQPPAEIAHLPALEPSPTADLERRIAMLENEVRCLVQRVLELEERQRQQASTSANIPMVTARSESVSQTELSMQPRKPALKRSAALPNKPCLICNTTYDPNHPRQHYKSRLHGINLNYALTLTMRTTVPIFCSLECKIRGPQPRRWTVPDEQKTLLNKTIHSKEFGSFYVCLVCGGAINPSCLLDEKPI